MEAYVSKNEARTRNGYSVHHHQQAWVIYVPKFTYLAKIGSDPVIRIEPNLARLANFGT